MKQRSRYAKRPGRKPSQQDPLTSVNTFVPNSFYRELQMLADIRGVPVNRLLLAAAMNVAKGVASFDIDISVPPNADNTIGLYKDEEAVLFRWISRNQAGISMDLMVACMDEIGIPDRQVLMYAFHALLVAGQIETFTEEGRIPKVKVTSIEKLTRKERFKTFAGEKPTALVQTNIVTEKKTGISGL